MSDPIPATSYQAGAFPGIPGTHAPGDYTLDYDARVATPIGDANSQDVQGQSVSAQDSTNNTTSTDTTNTEQPSA
jgi:hypothetical protein